MATVDREVRTFPSLPLPLRRAVALVGLALVVIGSFGPWLRSGRRVRSSYELFQVADRLGFLGDGPLRWLPRTWVCVPLAAALAFAADVAGWRRVGGTVGVGVGIYALVVSAGVIASPLHPEWGTMVGAVGGAVSVIGGLALLLPVDVSRKETAT
jgi:hypothetical protein